MAMPAIDLTGQRFGYLTVISRNGTSSGKTKKALWLCRCDCGNTVTRESQSLRSKHRPHPRHCGCRHGEWVTKHGMAKSRPYRIWGNMKDRCTNPQSKDWPNYGGRGIAVCERWLESFDTFWEDMEAGYADTLTLDREDNDGPYSPENCRWVSVQDQSNNTRVNRMIETPRGPMTMADAARHFGVNYATLHARLTRYDWPVEKALLSKPYEQHTTSVTLVRATSSLSKATTGNR